jgi:hypothetical protein
LEKVTLKLSGLEAVCSDPAVVWLGRLAVE